MEQINETQEASEIGLKKSAHTRTQADKHWSIHFAKNTEYMMSTEKYKKSSDLSRTLLASSYAE